MSPVLIHVADSAILFAVGPAITRAAIPDRCADLAALLRQHEREYVREDEREHERGPEDEYGRRTRVVICDVSGVTQADVVTVEALARLRLTARRQGWSLLVGGAGPDLRALLHLLGMAEVIPEADRLTEERGTSPRPRP